MGNIFNLADAIAEPYAKKRGTFALPILRPEDADNLPTTPFAITVMGNAFDSHRIQDGDELIVNPKFRCCQEDAYGHEIKNGVFLYRAAVLVLVDSGRPDREAPHIGLYRRDKYDELRDRSGNSHHRTEYKVLGTVTGHQFINQNRERPNCRLRIKRGDHVTLYLSADQPTDPHEKGNAIATYGQENIHDQENERWNLRVARYQEYLAKTKA